MATKSEAVKEFVVSLIATIVLAIVAAAVFIGCKTYLNMTDEAAAAMAAPVVAIAYNQLPNTRVNLFTALFDALKGAAGLAAGLFKKDDNGSLDLAGFIGQFWQLILWLVAMAAAAWVWVQLNVLKKLSPKYPQYTGVAYMTDGSGDYAVLDKDAFYKAYGKQLRVIPYEDWSDSMPLLPVVMNGNWANGVWFAPTQFVNVGQIIPAGSVVIVFENRDPWPEKTPSLKELYDQVKGSVNLTG
jgi:hypothetical protein